MRDKTYESVAVILGIFVGLAIASFCAIYTRTDDITVVDRYWKWQVRVTYTTTDTKIDSDGDVTTSTTTHTRCQHHISGRELPPVSPGLPCKPWAGDDVKDIVTYHLVFDLGDGKHRDRWFPPQLWDRLEPGVRRHVVRGIFGNIRGFATE